jgi:cytochrome P450
MSRNIDLDADSVQTAKQRIRQALSDKLECDMISRQTEDKGSLFHFIANSDMPESERSEERLGREAQTLLGAGTASTSRTIGFAMYYILSRPELKVALEEEVEKTMKEWPARVPTWADLERLPLLQAIIKESLR